MKTIWKFPLDITGEQTVVIPKDAWFLSVGDQGGRLTLWAMVDPESEREERPIRIHGTGHPIPNTEQLGYIGTVQMNGGALVWHVFKGRTEVEHLESVTREAEYNQALKTLDDMDRERGA